MREDTSLHVMIPSSILCSGETEVLQEKASREIRFLRVSRLHYIRNAPYTIYMYTVFYQPPVPVTVCMHGPPDGLVHHGSSVSAVVLGSLATTWLVYTLAKIPVCIIYSCLCRPDAWAWLECHALTLEDWRYWTHVHCPHTHTNTEAAPLFITLSPESYCSHTDAESENSIYTSNRAPLMTKIWGQFPKTSPYYLLLMTHQWLSVCHSSMLESCITWEHRYWRLRHDPSSCTDRLVMSGHTDLSITPTAVGVSTVHTGTDTGTSTGTWNLSPFALLYFL